MKNEKLTNRKLCYASIVVHTVMYCDAFVFCTRVTRVMRERKRVANSFFLFSFSLQLELDDTHSTLNVLNKQFYAITSICRVPRTEQSAVTSFYECMRAQNMDRRCKTSHMRRTFESPKKNRIVFLGCRVLCVFSISFIFRKKIFISKYF